MPAASAAAGTREGAGCSGDDRRRDRSVSRMHDLPRRKPARGVGRGRLVRHRRLQRQAGGEAGEVAEAPVRRPGRRRRGGVAPPLGGGHRRRVQLRRHGGGGGRVVAAGRRQAGGGHGGEVLQAGVGVRAPEAARTGGAARARLDLLHERVGGEEGIVGVVHAAEMGNGDVSRYLEVVW